MTDNEIIKALECCSKDNVKDCDDCPYEEIETKTYCANELIKDALDLINRQKAEVERLKNTLEDVLDRQPLLVERAEKYAKSEAIKEFAERLKAEKFIHKNFGELVQVEDIDSLVEEMTVNYESTMSQLSRERMGDDE